MNTPSEYVEYIICKGCGKVLNIDDNDYIGDKIILSATNNKK